MKQCNHATMMSPIPIEIEFGVLGKDCQNFGICRMIRLNQLFNNVISTSPCRRGRGYLIWSTHQTIQLSVLRASMLPCTFSKYFGTGIFVLEEDFYLSTSICSDNSHTYYLPKGSYKAMKNSPFVHLIIPIRAARLFIPISVFEEQGYPNAQSP